MRDSACRLGYVVVELAPPALRAEHEEITDAVLLDAPLVVRVLVVARLALQFAHLITTRCSCFVRRAAGLVGV